MVSLLSFPPFLSSALVDSLQPVYVSRTDPDSRLKTIKEIKRRCKPGSEWPQIVIFPEGTCTNGSCLITFKGGTVIEKLGWELKVRMEEK